MTGIDRSEASRALAKVIAYRNCGKDTDADTWASQLFEILGCSDLREPGTEITPS